MRRALVPVLLATSALGCAGRRIDASPAELSRYRRIAVLAHVPAPASALNASDPDGTMGWIMGAAGGDADKQLQQKLARSMTKFVVARRFEGGATAHLPRGMFEVVSATRVVSTVPNSSFAAPGSGSGGSDSSCSSALAPTAGAFQAGAGPAGPRDSSAGGADQSGATASAALGA